MGATKRYEVEIDGIVIRCDDEYDVIRIVTAFRRAGNDAAAAEMSGQLRLGETSGRGTANGARREGSGRTLAPSAEMVQALRFTEALVAAGESPTGSVDGRDLAGQLGIDPRGLGPASAHLNRIASLFNIRATRLYQTFRAEGRRRWRPGPDTQRLEILIRQALAERASEHAAA